MIWTLVILLAMILPANAQGACGDCNVDGVVNVLDALAASQHAVGSPPLSGPGLDQCDVDSSGAVVVLDALRIAQQSAGLPVILSCTSATWLYQLQGAMPPAVIASGFPLVVMDYSPDGSHAARYSAAEIATITSAGITALAYISIGEAEIGRFYFVPTWLDPAGMSGAPPSGTAPTWLGHSNPSWPDNYKVRYWDSDWRDTVLVPYLDAILLQGFAGIYLDIIDGFEYWADQDMYLALGGPETLSGPTATAAADPINDEAEAGRRMITLVGWIASYTRSGSPYASPGFLVFPQNGENILDHDAGGTYLATVDGIGVEDVFYDGLVAQPPAITATRLAHLAQFTSAGKTVLSVDYVDDGAGTPATATRIDDYVTACQAEGFACYIALEDRDLDEIHVIPGVQP